ncbi:MAG TPA: Holliday junction branch migration protein RuvA [Kiritimatiellia bacterium]|nr:Holliday junction branch migration protein RuvA [Kiritimatiellia bacterium]
MIDYLQGLLAEKHPARIVVEAAGVGYEVLIPLSTYDRLPAEGKPVKVMTHFHVREDAHILFGFHSASERTMFRMLLDVSGIGPKIALTALSGLSLRELKASIVEGDSKRLATISGIGKKTAERMVIELKDRISAGEALEATSGSAAPSAEDLRLRDAILALISLGYKQADAQKMVLEASRKAGPEAPLEDIIRRAVAGSAASS